MRLNSLLALICLALLASACPKGQPAGTGGNDAAGGKPAAGQESDSSASGVPAAGEVQIMADSALSGALLALEDGYRKGHPAGWHVQLLERAALQQAAVAEQERNDRPVQVYLIADTETLDALKAASLIDETSLRTFAGDSMAVVCRKGEKWLSGSVYDLSMLRFHAFGIGDPAQTSVGYYARQALISDGAYKRIEDRIRTFASSDALLDSLLKIEDPKAPENERGEVQLAMVFGSFAAQSKGAAGVLAVPRDLHEPIRYQAAAASGRAAEPNVMELLVYLAEDPAVQTTLESYGYLSRAKALETAK